MHLYRKWPDFVNTWDKFEQSTHTHIHTHTHKTNGPITTGTPTENTILYGRWKKRQWIHQSPIYHSQLRTRRHTYRPYRPYNSPYKHTHPIVCYVHYMNVFSNSCVFEINPHTILVQESLLMSSTYPILIRALRSSFLSFFVVVVETVNLYALHVVCIRCILCACCMCILKMGFLDSSWWFWVVQSHNILRK